MRFCTFGHPLRALAKCPPPVKPELPPKIAPPKGTFAAAFAISFAAFVAVNVVVWFLFSTPHSQRVGFPCWFWYGASGYSRFRALSLIIDLVLAVYTSRKIAAWYWLRSWRALNHEESSS
jgi:hypothetical protein